MIENSMLIFNDCDNPWEKDADGPIIVEHFDEDEFVISPED